MNEYPLTADLLAKIFAVEFTAHLVRYLLVAGFAFVLFYVWRNRRLLALKVQQHYPGRSDIRREFLYSLMSLAIFSSVGLVTFWMSRHGWLKVYLNIGSHGWGYLALSTVVLIFAHDTYFYWTHRFMHLKAVFPLVHRVHHLSHTPTPWAAFAFHPIEAVIEAGIFPLVAAFMPLHPLAAVVWLFYMTAMNVLGHCGFEILPRGFTRHPITRWHNTTVHHNMHHRFVHCNYSLYYNVWDRLMGTNHARYHEEFEQVKARGAAASESTRDPVTIATVVGK